MLRGACVRRCAWCVGGLRAVLWQWAGGGLPLPQGESPLTVARIVILIGPEPWQWGSGSFVLRGGGGSWKLVGVVLGIHTTSKNPRPVEKHKHTSLILLAGESSRFRGFFAKKTKLVTLW